MDVNNAYQPPQSEVSKECTLPTIGGWLRVFQVLIYIRIIAFALVPVYVAICIFDGTIIDSWPELLALTLESLPSFILSILIIRQLPSRNSKTPAKIKTLLIIMTVLSIGVSLFLSLAFNYGLLAEKPSSIGGDIVFYIIWASYLKRSRRVREFYGENAS